MSGLGLDRVQRVLSYEPHSGLFYWKEPPKGHSRLAGYVAGGITTGYVLIKIDGRKYKAHRLAWLMVTGEWPKKDIDHINGCPLDNRIDNLRLATASQNQANKARQRGKAIAKGVRALPSGRFQARITVGKRLIRLGTFQSESAALDAYAAAAQTNYGQFARAA